MTAFATERRPLEALLGSRRWIRRSEPFPHVVAYDVFSDAFAEELEQAWQEILRPGLDSSDQRLSYMGWYDAYGASFSPDEPDPFGVFISRGWHDLLASVAGVRATGQMNAGLHYHATGSAHGFVHNDLNPAWFAEYDAPDGIQVTRANMVSYTTGEVFTEGVIAVRAVRAVAMLYFLGNAPWSSGDGGELGLYSYHEESPGVPDVAVPPVNNSLVLFECTPYSYHGFISNRANPRASVIAWLHQSESEALARWGRDALVPFGRREVRHRAR